VLSGTVTNRGQAPARAITISRVVVDAAGKVLASGQAPIPDLVPGRSAAYALTIDLGPAGVDEISGLGGRLDYTQTRFGFLTPRVVKPFKTTHRAVEARSPSASWPWFPPDSHFCPASRYRFLQRTLLVEVRTPVRPRRAPQWVAVYRDMLAAMEAHLASGVAAGGRHNRALEASLRRRSRTLRSRLAYWERRLPKARREIAG